MPLGVAHHRWSEDKIARFIRDWDAGLSAEVLMEKYNTRQPGTRARDLRRRGFTLVRRRPGARRVEVG